MVAPLALGRRSVAGSLRTRRTGSDDSGVDSGARTAFRHADLGERGEATTAHPAMSVDPGKEARCGEGARRRRRGSRPSRERERKGEGYSAGAFCKKVRNFSVILKRSSVTGKSGLRVLFSVL